MVISGRSAHSPIMIYMTVTRQSLPATTTGNRSASPATAADDLLTCTYYKLLTYYQSRIIIKKLYFSGHFCLAYFRGHLLDTVERLIRDLVTPDNTLIVQIVGKLAELRDQRAVKPLIRLCDDDNKYVRIAAIKALSVIADSQSINALINVLGDEDDEVRKSAVNAFGHIGVPAMNPLITALKAKSGPVGSISRALGALKKPVIKPLLEVIANEDSLHIRQGATRALGFIGRAAIKPLIDSLGEESKNVRYCSSEALATIGKYSVKPLIDVLEDKYPSDFRNITKKMFATITLGKIGDSRAINPLIKCLQSKDKSLRYCAAYALGRLANRDALRPLVRLLENNDRLDDNEYFKKEQNLGLFCESSQRQTDDICHGVHVKIELLEEKGYIVKRHAIIALARICDVQAREALLSIIKNKKETEEIKEYAEFALSHIELLNCTKPKRGNRRIKVRLAINDPRGSRIKK